MTKRISNALLENLAHFLSTQMGWYYPKEKHLDLLKGIRSVTKEFGFEDPEECIHWLTSKPLSQNQMEILACQFTVGETYFFREPKVFDALEKHILCNLIRSRRGKDRRLRIWSAGSCTGEEAYSAAILLTRMIPDIASWNITILATDINPKFLEKAQEGVYRDWSFRGTPFWLKENYFSKTKDGFFEIHPHIKRMVKFQCLNLVEDTYPSLFNDTNAMDIVFCRNVLMYFTPVQVRNVIERFYLSLIENGWLIVGSSETSHIIFSRYVTVNFPGAILYQKDTQDHRKIRHYCQGESLSDPLSASYSMKPVYYFQVQKDSLAPRESTDNPSVQVDKKMQQMQSETEPVQDLYDRAVALFEAGCYDSIIDQVSPLALQDSTNVKLITLLAKVYANQGKLSDAIQWCERAIETDKLNAESHHLRAIILQEQGQTESAMASLKRALYLNSNFIVAHYLLGNLFLQIGRIKESQKYHRNALQLLQQHKQEDIIPSADGITAGRLTELIRMAMMKEHEA